MKLNNSLLFVVSSLATFTSVRAESNSICSYGQLAVAYNGTSSNATSVLVSSNCWILAKGPIGDNCGQFTGSAGNYTYNCGSTPTIVSQADGQQWLKYLDGVKNTCDRNPSLTSISCFRRIS